MYAQTHITDTRTPYLTFTDTLVRRCLDPPCTFCTWLCAQEKNAEKILFGYDQVVDEHGPQPKELIIVEGEMDVLGLNEAGFTNAISVPDGGCQR